VGRPTLYGLYYSPWTERARWALDHHGIEYRYREHVPFLGEPLLRFAARETPAEKKSVPLLVDDSGAYGDSLDIVRRADAIGGASPLVTDEAELRRWAALVEPALGAIRARVTKRVLADEEALREAATAAAPYAVAGLLKPVARAGARFIANKYQATLDDEAGQRAAVRALLEAARDALDGYPFLAGDAFGAVDILVAGALQGVQPVDAEHLRLKPATRRAWTWPELADEAGDLIEWRDALYAERRHA